MLYENSNFAKRFGKEADIVKQLPISRSTFLQLRDNDPDFPAFFRRGRVCIYDLDKLIKYFSA
jgi:hypothetical protein